MKLLPTFVILVSLNLENLLKIEIPDLPLVILSKIEANFQRDLQSLDIARIIIVPEQKKPSCPTDLETLITQILPQLPSYANRVMHRSNRTQRNPKLNYILQAERLEQLEPLPFEVEFQNADEIYPVFIKTSARRYEQDKLIKTKSYHWLFLRKSIQGWEFVKMFSKSNPYPRYGLYSLPGESSDSAIAQAIRLLLRDCQA